MFSLENRDKDIFHRDFLFLLPVLYSFQRSKIRLFFKEGMYFMEKLLIINPGSTSTKIAVYEGLTRKFSENISHPLEDLKSFPTIIGQTEYRTHVITDCLERAGTPLSTMDGIIGIGGLLCMGVGDTLRVSLTADPVEEVIAAKRILQAAGIRRSGPDLISCPTCGRTKYDMIPIAREVERRLKDCAKPITVAVMGCVVNGPGEASGADVGIAGGKGEGLLFAKGKILRKVPQEQLVDALFQEIDKL